ncbi:hypothetical protein KR084_010827 [Drosophila pseudotakahashii]|nr:hypothetical protein KR084_010827 [Drosophila pseudotakahashii]
MGKAQSKRSIDITTDPKKVGEGDEVAGKVEKIDVDQKTDAPAVNGDAATPKEGGDEAATAEKKETEEQSENDKDLTTEKNAAAAAEGGDAAVETPKGEEGSPKEGAAGEDITPLADESIKSKSKKDKVKKKWSFRSISFGKKDKQKPAKSEEAVSPTSGTTSPTTAEAEAAPAADAAPAEPAAATNGEAEKPADNATVETTSESASKDEAKPAENGSATEQEKQANGEAEKAAPAAPATVEAAAQPKPADEPATVTATESNTTATATVTATEEVPVVKESQPEPEVVTNGHGAGEALTNGSSNGLAESPVAETAPAADNIPSNVEDEQPHQNGTNGTTTPPPTPVAVETEKGQQIEVNNHTRTDSTTQEHNSKNFTVNTSTTTTTKTTTEITENTALKNTISTETERTCTSTVTETVVAAAELVQTQTILTKTTNTILPTSHTQASNEVIEAVSTSQAEEEVVAAIIKAVSSELEAETETETEAEGFVVVAPVSTTEVEVPVSTFLVEPVAEIPEVEKESVVEVPKVESKPATEVPEVETEQVAEIPEVESESVIVETRSSSPPPPLPKSPPPSRVSAFVLSDEVIEEQVTPNTPEVNEVKRDEIEQQAISIVAEITEQAAEIVTEKEKIEEDAKEESVPEVVEEETASTVEVEEVSPAQSEEVTTAPSPTAELTSSKPDVVQETIEDQAASDEEESVPVPAPIVPADVVSVVLDEEHVAFTESVDSEVQKETISISSTEEQDADEQAANENQVETILEQPAPVEEILQHETTKPQVISEDAHSDDDKENENDNDLVGKIISDLDEPVTKAGGDLLAELDVRPTELEGESNNKVDLAKDLKEKNAAADVTTQEQLPVTCE